MRLAGGTRSSVKQAGLFRDQSIDFPSVKFEYSPGLGYHTRRCRPATGFRKIALERLPENLTHLLVPADRLQLRSAEQVFVQKRADFSAGHVMTLS
jgi:hypothetical protein